MPWQKGRYSRKQITKPTVKPIFVSEYIVCKLIVMHAMLMSFMNGPLGGKAETKLVFGPHLNTRVTTEEEPQFFNIRHHQDVNRDTKDHKIT